MTPPPTTPTSRWLPVQFVALSLAWGSSFLFIKVGLDGLSPLQVVTGRMVLGALALGLVLLVGRTPLPRGRRAWGHIGVVSLLLCVIPFSLFAWAEQYIASGLASIYNATTPLTTVAVTLVALRDERPRPAQLAGLLVGLGGVLIVLAPWQGLDLSGALLAQLACLLATVSYGVAFVHLRKFVSPLGLPAVSVATAQVGVGAVALALCAPVLARQPIALDAAVLVAMIGLGVFGTGFAYIWNTSIVAGWGATAASTVTYLTPVVGVALGAVLLGERITWNQPVGAAVVIVGVLVSRRRSGIAPAGAPAR
jgi:drug/metabolite transporter (DMT)-like permease